MDRGFTKLLVVLLLVVAIFAAYTYLHTPYAGDVVDDADQQEVIPGPDIRTNYVVAVSNAAATSIKNSPESSNRVAVVRETLSEAQKTLEKIDVLISDDNLVEAYRLAKTLMNSDDLEVRQEVVDTFGWIGLMALPELSIMLKDGDEDIAESALDHWEVVVEEISDESLKCQILTAGIKTIDNQESAEGLVMMFDSLDSGLAIRSIVDIIQNGNPVASEVAREHYEFTTDEVYSTPEAAEAWIVKDAAE